MSTQDRLSLTGLRNCEKELMRSGGLILYHARRGLILPRNPMSLNLEITGLPEMVDFKSFYDTVWRVGPVLWGGHPKVGESTYRTKSCKLR